ncbi:hypothetical protein OsJ_25699 [Oryza sativa Japonica Group]|uniref:DUF7769 domain-containing protein n=1 Tax=Oryza sativa subsp. japonica TaxID=39947 RepID=A3BNQ8_ORYSJ|nr:hypothetical protein OsJ_25699 [Oryza sativa Japonica Group]
MEEEEYEIPDLNLDLGVQEVLQDEGDGIPDLNLDPAVQGEDAFQYEDEELPDNQCFGAHEDEHPDPAMQAVELSNGRSAQEICHLNMEPANYGEDDIVFDDDRLYVLQDQSNYADEEDFDVYSPYMDVVFDEDLHTSSDEEDTQQDNIKRRKYLPEAENKAIYGALLASTINGKLVDRDTTTIIATMVDVTRRVVQDIWTKAKKCLAAGVEVDFKSKKPDVATLNAEPRFIDMQNIVHIDEKWFNATMKNKTFYLVFNEDEPVRCVQNKNAIDKVMFLSALAKPRYDEEGNCYFDVKIGIWPFVRKEPAQRSSRNRPKGTLVTKSITVSRETSRAFLITKVIPTIASCWPREDVGKTIWIQQDNARTHILPNDEAFALAVAQVGLDIRIMNQRPNSPNMNVLDLGFFASLQSKTYLKNCSNMDELISNVDEEYNEYNSNLVSRVFLTLQACFIEVMKADGGNGYKIPHMNKDRLERLDMLPTSLTCDIALYNKVMQTLLN